MPPQAPAILSSNHPPSHSPSSGVVISKTWLLLPRLTQLTSTLEFLSSTPSASLHSWALLSSHSTAHGTPFSTDKLLVESSAWDPFHSAPFRRLTSCLSFRLCRALASLRSIKSCLSGTTVQVTSWTTRQLSDYCAYLPPLKFSEVREWVLFSFTLHTLLRI